MNGRLGCQRPPTPGMHAPHPQAVVKPIALPGAVSTRPSPPHTEPMVQAAWEPCTTERLSQEFTTSPSYTGCFPTNDHHLHVYHLSLWSPGMWHSQRECLHQHVRRKARQLALECPLGWKPLSDGAASAVFKETQEARRYPSTGMNAKPLI